MTWPLRVRLAYDLLSGLLYLHTRQPPIAHRDLKSPNLFVRSLRISDDRLLAIGDFGVSQVGSAHQPDKRDVDCPLWLAPEALHQFGQNTIRSDIYSVGIILWEMCSGEDPFAHLRIKTENKLETLIQNGERPLTTDDGALWPAPWVEILQRCWQDDPNLRPTCQQLVAQLQRAEQMILGPDSSLRPRSLDDYPHFYSPPSPPLVFSPSAECAAVLAAPCLSDQQTAFKTTVLQSPLPHVTCTAAVAQEGTLRLGFQSGQIAGLQVLEGNNGASAHFKSTQVSGLTKLPILVMTSVASKLLCLTEKKIILLDGSKSSTPLRKVTSLSNGMPDKAAWLAPRLLCLGFPSTDELHVVDTNTWCALGSLSLHLSLIHI